MQIFKLNQNKNYNYRLPDDKQLLMLDYYLITYLNSVYDEKNILNINEKLKFSLEEAESSILNYLKDHLLYVVHFSIIAEFQHFIKKTNWRDVDINENKYFFRYLDLFFDNFKLIKDNEVEKSEDFGDVTYLKSYEAFKKLNVSKFDSVKIAQFAFKNLSWDIDFGGKNWEKICNGWLRLYGAKSKPEIITAIDNIYHLQHNTGSVFSKIDSYGGEEASFWIEDTLNFKRDVKNIWDLFDSASDSIKKLALPIISKVNNNGESYKEHNLNKEIRINKAINKNLKISTQDFNWMLERLRSGNYPDEWNNSIINHFRKNGDFPDIVSYWLGSKLQNDTLPFIFVNEIFDFIYKNKKIPDSSLYLRDFIKKRLKSGNYPEYLDDVIAENIKNNKFWYLKDVILDRIQYGNKKWLDAGIDFFEENGYPPLNFEPFFEKILESENYPKKLEYAILDFYRKNNFFPDFAIEWAKKRKVKS